MSLLKKTQTAQKSLQQTAWHPAGPSLNQWQGPGTTARAQTPPEERAPRGGHPNGVLWVGKKRGLLGRPPATSATPGTCYTVNDTGGTAPGPGRAWQAWRAVSGRSWRNSKARFVLIIQILFPINTITSDKKNIKIAPSQMVM